MSDMDTDQWANVRQVRRGKREKLLTAKRGLVQALVLFSTIL